jgi:WD40 repeat protein
VIAELKSHKYGISALAFTPNSRYLVSLGTQHDGFLNLWDLKSQSLLASNKITTKLSSIAINEEGTVLLTAGVKHIKFWNLEPFLSPSAKKPEKVQSTSTTHIQYLYTSY